MLVLGGVIGFALGLVLVAIPASAGMAAQTGLVLVVPIVGNAIAAPIAINLLFVAVIHVVLALIGYLFCALATPLPAGGSGPVPMSPPGVAPAPWQFAERFGRGWLIGVNSSVSLVALPYALPWLFSWLPPISAIFIAASPILQIAGIIIFILNLMALSESICAANWYAALLGWTSWIAPAAWPATLVGIIFLAISLVAVLFGSAFRVSFEWWTASFVGHGGPLHVVRTAYNLGNVLFVHPDIGRRVPSTFPSTTGGGLPGTAVDGRTADGLTFHETGHTLNVAAFGAWFHYIGAIDQNLIGSGANAYPELLAEGHQRTSTRPWFPLWAPPVGLVGTAVPNSPPNTVAATVNGIGASTIVVPLNAPLALAAPTAGADPDNYPLGAISPGVTPNTGELWEFTLGPGTVVTPNSSPTTGILTSGGDYRLIHAITDGIEQDAPTGFLIFDTNLANVFTISAVEAVANVPATGALSATIPIDATGSTAGSAGAPPSVAMPPIPSLTIVWTTDSPNLVVANPNAESTTIQAAVAGTYTVTLTVTTAGGVAHSMSTPITIA